MARNQTNVPLFPGIWPTIRAGFDATTQHWWLILLPIALDLWLWLGPRVSMAPLLEALIVQWQVLLGTMEAAEPPALAELATLGESINAMGHLSVPLLGTPSLLGLAATAAPISKTLIEVADLGRYFALFAALSAAGLFLGGIYFSLIVQALRDQKDWAYFVRHTLAAVIGRVFLLALALIAVVIAFYIPLSLISVVGALFNPTIGMFVILAGLTVLMWVILYLTFTLHSMIWSGRSLLQSINYSVRFIQAFLPTAFFLLLVIVIGLSIARRLWIATATDSWLTLVSIFGHAFISTALIVATFIFYRDREPYLTRHLAQRAATRQS